MKYATLLIIAALFALGRPAIAAPLSPESLDAYDTKVRPFLEANCFKCHGEKKTLAGLRVDTLETDFFSGKSADVWKEMYDRIGNGTMPPKKQPRPDAAQASVVTDWILQELVNAEKRAKGAEGRIPTRRLNRTEYVNSLRDLFYLDDHVTAALERELPADGKVDGFDRGGAGLFIDEALMTKYLEVADLVLNGKVFGAKPPAIHDTSYAQKDFRPYWPDQAKSTDILTYPNESPLRNTETRRIPVGPNMGELKNGGIEYISSGPQRFGNLDAFGFKWGWGDRLTWGKFTEGRYRLKVHCGTFKGTGKYAVDEVRLSFVYSANSPIEAKGSVVIDAALDQPKDFEIMVYLNALLPGMPTDYNLRWNAYAPDVVVRNPEIVKIDKSTGDASNYYATLLHRTNPPATAAQLEAAKKGKEEALVDHHVRMREIKVFNAYNPEIDVNAIPRIWLDRIELEGPIGDWPPRGQTELLFDGDKRPFDKQYMREIFARFLPRAYRRAIDDRKLDAVVAWVLKNQQSNDLSGHEAVLEGVKMVICSPDFLMIQEPAGTALSLPKGNSEKQRKLTDYELASRLSYFLWSTMPDAELFKLAGESKLHDPATLAAQVRRMIADPKGNSLVVNFAGQWLKVRDFDSVITDRVEYKSYDDALRASSRQEPIEFFNTVLHENLSILNFLDSKFVVIDGRLATHYGISGIEGPAFRKVTITPDMHRGGVLGMAGVMTLLSDGLRTLPVRRGSYVLETLWNQPPRSPPPNVGDLPPVGKVKTVRERLELHRKSDSCASCHARIDPFGLALENYDAIGAWRDRMNGERFKGDKGSPPLDASGVLPSGREFKNLEEFKEALLAEKEQFIHGFIEKMLAYALGRPVSATDRPTINEIMKALEPRDAAEANSYQLQSLIQAIAASQPFQTK